MSNKSQRYSDYLSPRGSGAFLTGQSYDKSQYYSNQQFTEDDRGTNELNCALSRIDALTAEKNQLKSTLKVVLDRRSSDASTVSGSNQKQRSFNPGYASSPRIDAIAELEKRIEILQRENNDLKYSYHKVNERLTTTISENNDYLEKMVEFEKISNYNLQLKNDMLKLNRELSEVGNRVIELEEREREFKENIVFEDEFGLQAADHINHILELLEKREENHYIIDCFLRRFENLETLQKQLEEKRFGRIAEMSLNFIIDLIQNADANRPVNKLRAFSVRNVDQSEGSRVHTTEEPSDLGLQKKLRFRDNVPLASENQEQQSYKQHLSQPTDFNMRRPSHSSFANQGGFEGTNQKETNRSIDHAKHKLMTTPNSHSNEPAAQLSESKRLNNYRTEESFNNTSQRLYPSDLSHSENTIPKNLNQRKLSTQQAEHNANTVNHSNQVPFESETQYDHPSLQSNRIDTQNLNSNNASHPQNHPNPLAFSASPTNIMHPQVYYDAQHQPANYFENPQNLISHGNINQNMSSPQPSPSHHNPYNFVFPPYQGYFIPASYAYQIPPHQLHPNNYFLPAQAHTEPSHHTQTSSSNENNKTHLANSGAIKTQNSARNPTLPSSRKSEPNISLHQLGNTNSRVMNQSRRSSEINNQQRRVSESVRNSEPKEHITVEEEGLLKQMEYAQQGSSARRSQRGSFNIPKTASQNHHLSTFASMEQSGPIREDAERDFALDGINKYTQVGSSIMQSEESIHGMGDYALCKATQTSSRPSKANSRWENVPPLDFGTINPNKGRADNRQLLRTTEEKSLLLKKNESSIILHTNSSPLKFTEIPQDDYTSINESQLTNQIHRNDTYYTGDSARNGRATMGMMGNIEASRSYNKTLNNSREGLSPSLKPSIQKSFRVSFGKTINPSQFGNKDKPRFDIVPNEMICIQEASRKKHLTPERKFNIITNEKKGFLSDSNLPNSGSMKGQSPDPTPSLPISINPTNKGTNPSEFVQASNQ